MTERTEVLADLALRVARADWYLKHNYGHFGRAEAECIMRGATEGDHIDAARNLQDYTNAAIEISNLLRECAK